MPPTKLPKSGSDQALARLRLDARLSPLRDNKNATAVPRGGWLRAVRKALGMSMDDVAERLGITRSSVARMESSEQRETIQLDTLRRVARAMDCELAYVLIPKASLEQTVKKQRNKAAQQLSDKVRVHMALEGQEARDPSLDQWRLDRAAELVPARMLWKSSK
ncbi:MAG: mobile mystery protein A [Phycisphaerae bacterium]|nr:mobile mystery protein A [Gemmatimonadaceae bacterium]